MFHSEEEQERYNKKKERRELLFVTVKEIKKELRSQLPKCHDLPQDEISQLRGGEEKLALYTEWLKLRKETSEMRRQAELAALTTVHLTPPDNLDCCAFNFVIFIEMLQYRGKNKQDQQNRKRNQRLETFPYFALIRVARYISSIFFDLADRKYFYELPLVVPHMVCSVAVRIHQVDLSSPFLCKLALPLLKNRNFVSMADAMQLTMLSRESLESLTYVVPCCVDYGDFWFRDIELIHHVIAANILDDADKDLPQLEGLRPVQARPI